MSQPRPVRLAPGSLALVLGGPPEDPPGAELFQDFQAANRRCFWNPRLAGAAGSVRPRGWLRGGVLLLEGPCGELEVLRDAWVRRALRAPQGCTIRAVGDVSPVQMSPVSQSQFIPLAEVVCCAVSDMNAAQVVVTQDSLMETLVKHYPGIATPSQDILYSTLGNLIKERKIYHTGDGYFIVTPQTYFITNNSMKDNHKRTLSEDNPPLPPSVTYLVSFQSCTDVRGNNPMVSHCPSCQCFSNRVIQTVQEHQSIHEPDGKGPKDTKESTPFIENRAISASVEHNSCDQAKPSVSVKEKEKSSKKFGLGLFRRNASKKDKPKREYTTFAAQFPPEEWPVRDEDNLDNIPRDIEHEIIKRINPVLTVDNLLKHTVLMQKVEQQKKYISKGTSTEVLTAKQKHYSKAGLRKKLNKCTQHRRKGPPSKEKHQVRSRKEFSVDEPLQASDHHTEHLPGRVSCGAGISHVPHQKQLKKNNTLEVESHCVYKKPIQNPFQGVPCRDNPAIKLAVLREINSKNLSPSAKSQRGRKRCELKKMRSGKEESRPQRSRCLDSTTTTNIENEEKYSNLERHAFERKHNDLTEDNTSATVSIKGDIEYSSNYPESSTLRMEDKCKHLGEGDPFPRLNSAEPLNNTGNVQKKTHMHKEAIAGKEQEVTKYPLTAMSTSHYDKTPDLCGLLQQTPTRCPSFGNCDKFRLAEKDSIPRSWSESKSEIASMTAATGPKPSSASREDYTDDGRNRNQKEVEEDDCSSLCLEDDDSVEDSAVGRMLQEHRQQRFTEVCDSYQTQIVQTFGRQGSWNDNLNSRYSASTQGIHPSYNKEEKGYCDLQETLNSSEYQSLQKDLYLLSDIPPPFYQKTEERSVVTECLQVSDTVDGSIFDYCNASEADSQAKTVQKSSNESEEKSVCWGLGQRTEEMRKRFEQHFKLFNTAHSTSQPQNAQREPNHSEGAENLSITGDSGIDSPRTRISLASNNSIMFDGLKRRTLLPSIEGMNNNLKGRGIHAKNVLLQLTPVINV